MTFTDFMLITSTWSLTIVTIVVVIEQGMVDNTTAKIATLLSGGRLRRALTYQARHAIQRCLDCIRSFAAKLGRHERPKHEAPR